MLDIHIYISVRVGKNESLQLLNLRNRIVAQDSGDIVNDDHDLVARRNIRKLYTYVYVLRAYFNGTELQQTVQSRRKGS